MRMQELCAARKVPFVVTMLPELHDQTNDFFLPIRKIYSDVAKDAGATFLDLNSAVASTGRRQYWVSDDDAHPNALAASILLLHPPHASIHLHTVISWTCAALTSFCTKEDSTHAQCRKLLLSACSLRWSSHFPSQDQSLCEAVASLFQLLLQKRLISMNAIDDC